MTCKPIVPSLPVGRAFLLDRYDISAKTLFRWRVLLKQNTKDKNIHISIQEAEGLENIWVSTNKNWGLGLTHGQVKKFILDRRSLNPNYDFGGFVLDYCGISCDRYLKSRGIQPLLDALREAALARGALYLNHAENRQAKRVDPRVLQDFNPFSLPSIPFDSRSYLPCTAGIYFLLSENEVLYVGKSVNIFARWQGHHKLSEARQLNGLRISWLSLKDEDALSDTEEFCISRFQPKLNRESYQLLILENCGS